MEGDNNSVVDYLAGKKVDVEWRSQAILDKSLELSPSIENFRSSYIGRDGNGVTYGMAKKARTSGPSYKHNESRHNTRISHRRSSTRFNFPFTKQKKKTEINRLSL